MSGTRRPTTRPTRSSSRLDRSLASLPVTRITSRSWIAVASRCTLLPLIRPTGKTLPSPWTTTRSQSFLSSQYPWVAVDTNIFVSSQVKIYYSVGQDPLKSVTNNLSVNLAGNGQFQLGILKKPTGTSDVVNSGYQEKNLNEGQIYGGLFLEDSADGCVSL